MRRILALSILVGALVIAQSAPAGAAVITFNSLADGAGNTAIAAAIKMELGCIVTCVTVTGGVAEKDYDGDDHVVGPGALSASKSNTLGTSDGATQHLSYYDTFIRNNSSSTKIVMDFTFKIYSASFDYEIFPDATCQTGQNCGTNWPDFSFYADGIFQFKSLGVMPGNPANTFDPYFHSPISGTHNELTPQLLAHSLTYLFPNGVKKLEFVDWPVTIGVDNLDISTTPPRDLQAVPEPASMLLMATGLGELIRRRRKQSR